MNKAVLLAVIVSLVVTAPLGLGAEGSRTLTGKYSSGNGSGPLEAIFQPAGEGRWKVEFHFRFQGRAHTFSGTALGSLSDGGLEGKVRNESGKRTFTFEGEFEGGTFQGTHAELERRGPEATGTMTLEAETPGRATSSSG